MKNKLIHFLRRIAYWLEHSKDDYGKPGFTGPIMYKGKPVVMIDEKKPRKSGTRGR